MSSSWKEPLVANEPTTLPEPIAATAPQPSVALANELKRLETEERAYQDRRQQEEFARQRELGPPYECGR